MDCLADNVVFSRNVKALAQRRSHRWVPLIWLPYFFFFLLQPAVTHASKKIWMLDSLGGAIFLVFYFGMFWGKTRQAWFYLTGIVALGVLFAPINGGAATFYIYAAVFVPFLTKTEIGAVRGIAVIVGIAALETWLLHLGWGFLLYAGFFAAVISVGNIFIAQRNRANEKLRLAHDEIEHLAKIAERERIARDLHDVLGHTLSVIILKSELAGKLIDRDPARAKAEIADVEQTSRQALNEVRSTIRGYRNNSLESELKQATGALETAGIVVKAETADIRLSPAQESVVALVVREAITNVVRHAQARNCQLRLSPSNGNCLLEIADDGLGGLQTEGNGIRGMRERIEALGGMMQRDTSQGTRITIQFPLAAVHSNGSH
jgi:two-component system, NarL family, sensor histidine kinase DesK